MKTESGVGVSPALPAGSAPPPRRSSLAVSIEQLRAIEAWNAEASAELVGESVSLTREMRLDLTRRMDARRREQAALLARAAEHLARSGDVMRSTSATRAVLAHRNTWLRDGVAQRLEQRGIEVVGSFEDGADAAGTIIAEQPDLVLVEDRLPTLSGLEVVRRARRYSPWTLVGVHVQDTVETEAARHAGARLVFARRIPAAQIADDLVDCLQSVQAG